MRQTIVKGLGALAGVATCAVMAQAADLPLRTAPPAFTAVPINIEDWSGVYVGSTYGYGFNSFRNRQLGSTTVPTAVGASRTTDADGQAGGAVVGYRFQTGRFVYGAEGSIDLNVIRHTDAGGGIVPAQDDSLYDIRFRGLIGYEFGHLMPFIAGGAVLNETYLHGTDSIGGIPNYFGQNKQTVGYTVGAGLEYKFNPRDYFSFLPSFVAGPLILRAEYMYQSLPDETYAYAGQTYRVRQDGNFLRAAVIYRLGDNPARSDMDQVGNVNWGGGYGGILGGYGDATVRTTAPNGARNNSIGGDGGLGGIYAGTNFMFGRFMVGFDGSTSFSDFTGNGRLPDNGQNVNYRSYIQADIRGRAGYAFGRFLPFVAAGIGFSRSEQIDTATTSQRGRIPPDSLTLGGGLDYRVAEHVSLRLEDLYEFRSGRNIADFNGVPYSENRDANIVRAGLAYHFE